MNNKELQMTTVMPTMKKSLLALAVAGTMAMSGGAYATATAQDVATTNANIALTISGTAGASDDIAATAGGLFDGDADTAVTAGVTSMVITTTDYSGVSNDDTDGVVDVDDTVKATTIVTDGITIIDVSSIDFSADGSLTIGADLGAGVVTNGSGTNNYGTATFVITANNTTLATSIGADGAALKLVTLNTATGDTGTITGDTFAQTVTAVSAGTIAFGDKVTATTLNLDGAGAFTFADTVTAAAVISGDSTSTVAANVGIVGAVTNDGTSGNGTLTFAATTADTTLASSTIGTSTKLLKAVNVTVTEAGNDANATATFDGAIHATTVNATATADNGTQKDTVAFSGAVTATTFNALGAGTVTFAEDVTAAVVFGAGAGATGTVSISADKKIVGAVTTATTQNIGQTTEGILTFANATTDTVLANSTIGTTTNALKALNVGAATAATGTVTGAVFATTVTTAGAGTSKFSGLVTATTINADGTGTLDSDAGLTAAVAFGADGTIDVADGKIITGAVTTDTTNTGTLTFATNTGSTFDAASTHIGASTKLLKAVNISTSANEIEIVGNVFATTVTATATDTTDTDTVKFNGTVNGTTLNLDGAGAFTLNDDVTAAVIVSGDSTATVAANKKIVGAVTNDGTSGNGTLTFAATTADTTLASSTIGATGAVLKAVNVTSTANTATLSGDVFATTVTATATDTTGSDKVAFNGTVNAATLALVGTGTFSFNDVATTTSDLDIVAGAKIVLTDGIIAGDTVFAATQNGSALTTSAVVTMPETLNSGSINFIDYVGSGNTGAADAALLTVNDTTLATYAATVGSDATIVKITATKKSAATIASELNITSNQASALDNAVTALATGDATGLSAMQTALTTGITESNVEQMQPDAGAATGAAMAVTGGVNNVIAGRQANTKIAFNTLGKQSGVSTGDAANDAVVWAQVFTSDATQDKVGSIDGYDADNQGLVVGWESAGKSGSKLGLSLSYSDTDVDGKSAAVSHTDTTATQVSVYGNNGESIDWMVGYASADNDTKRTINFGGLNRTATGNYNSDIIMAKAGRSFASTEAGGFTLTPKADLSWTHISNDGYTETGAGNLNLIVASSSNDVVTARAGAEFTQRIESNDAVTIPRVSIMAGYDLKNDRAETTSTFTGGGSSFTTQGIDPEKASLSLGFGVDHVSDDSTASFDFNADIKDGYSNNTASLTFKSKF